MEHNAARLRAPIAALVVLATMVLAGCATSHRAPSPGAQPGGHTKTSTSSAPAGVTVTKFRSFAPFGRSGAPTAGVVAHRSGSCFTTSITVAATGAYRCLAGNAILDPCFLPPGSTGGAARVLECYDAPWSRATQLRVRSLPAAAAAHIARPWAIELAGGVRCVVTNGTPTVLRGVALGYACAGESGGAAGLEPSNGKTGNPLYQALYRAADGLVRVVPVITAWRAAVA